MAVRVSVRVGTVDLDVLNKTEQASVEHQVACIWDRGTSEQGGAVLSGGTEAKKAAEANLIARREETAAMRCQAGTAKLLAGTIARDVEEQIRRRPVTRR